MLHDQLRRASCAGVLKSLTLLCSDAPNKTGAIHLIVYIIQQGSRCCVVTYLRALVTFISNIEWLSCAEEQTGISTGLDWLMF